MNLTIEQSEIETAIRAHLQKLVNDGLGYETKKALETAIAKAVTPEVVAGFVDSAMRALTDKDLTARILEETHRAIGQAVQLVVQESIVSMIARLRGWKPDGYASRDKQDELDALRARLFPVGGAVGETASSAEKETNIILDRTPKT